MNKMWSHKILEYYSLMKNNEVLKHRTTWKKLKIIMSSEKSQIKKLHFVQFYFYEFSRKSNIVVTEEKSVIA